MRDTAAPGLFALVLWVGGCAGPSEAPRGAPPGSPATKSYRFEHGYTQ